MAEYGLGGPEDFGEAVHHYEKAIELQHAESMYNLALMYAYGRGVAQDYMKAAQLFDTAAQQHKHPAAFYFLGLMHTHGHGVELDYHQALRNFKLAALSSHPVAQDAKAHASELQALISQAEEPKASKQPAEDSAIIQDAFSVLDANGKPITSQDIAHDTSGKLARSLQAAGVRARKVGEAISFRQSPAPHKTESS